MSEFEWNSGMADVADVVGPTSRSMVRRFPVVSRRRWVQRTAFGADDVPEVNSRFHNKSTSGSGPRSGSRPVVAPSSASSKQAPPSAPGRVVPVARSWSRRACRPAGRAQSSIGE